MSRLEDKAEEFLTFVFCKFGRTVLCSPVLQERVVGSEYGSLGGRYKEQSSVHHRSMVVIVEIGGRESSKRQSTGEK